MKRDLDRLARVPYDVVVVGGGIYGVCAAREAALHGLSVCVLDRGDFGAETSSRSLKILHGGLRYLQHLDVRRMRQSILERRKLFRIAPHLVRPLPCVIPTWGHGVRGREVMAAALAVNDLVGLDRNLGLPPGSRIPRGRVLSRGELLSLAPGIASDGVTGGALWYDAQAWSTERLLLAFLAAGVEAGADAANHVEAERLLVHGRSVVGVAARDAVTGRRFEVRGRLVLNAAGPWVDRVLETVPDPGGPKHFRTSKAFNVVVRRIAGDHAVGIPGGSAFHDEDSLVDRGARLLFLVPWRSYTMVGTKHVRWTGAPDRFVVSRDEIERLLAEVNHGYPPARLSMADVVAVHAGILPEKDGVTGPDVQLEKHPLLLDHARIDGIDGLITVIGVKWTTARLVAEQAIRLVRRKLGAGERDGPADAPVSGGDMSDFERFLEDGMRDRPSAVPPESMEHLLRAHGTGVRRVLERVSRDEALGRPVHDGSPTIGAEVVHAAAEEMGERLDDVILRRTEAWLGAPSPHVVAHRCATLVAGPLGWDPARVRAETERAVAALERVAVAPREVETE